MHRPVLAGQCRLELDGQLIGTGDLDSGVWQYIAIAVPDWLDIGDLTSLPDAQVTGRTLYDSHHVIIDVFDGEGVPIVVDQIRPEVERDGIPFLVDSPGLGYVSLEGAAVSGVQTYQLTEYIPDQAYAGPTVTRNSRIKCLAHLILGDPQDAAIAGLALRNDRHSRGRRNANDDGRRNNRQSWCRRRFCLGCRSTSQHR
jgi:hypothetical protein